jgi:hypothetical protein
VFHRDFGIDRAGLRPRRGAFWAGLMALYLGLGAEPAGADGRVVSPGEMRNLAVKGIDTGYPDTAMELTSALLLRDSRDVQAWLIRSRAARNLGQYDVARQSAQLAWEYSSGDPIARHAAAMAMAQALSSEGKRTMAQLWLRRAAQVAPNNATKAQAVRDFHYVRSRNRWSTHLTFNVAPKSNINNGSAKDTMTHYVLGQPIDLPLPGAAQALSGIEYSIGGSTRYRIKETTSRATDLTFAARYTTYGLSDEAKALVPTAKGSDYALATTTIGLRHKWLSDDGRVEYKVGGSVGLSWYGGDPYGTYYQADAGATIRTGARSRLNLKLGTDITRGATAPHAEAAKFSTRFSQSMPKGGAYGLTLGVTESRSKTDVADFTDVSAGIDVTPRFNLLGAAPRFGMGLRQRDYPVSAYAPGMGRRDREAKAWMDLTFSKVDYFGFHPTVRLQASRTESSVDLFDINRSGISVGISSAY